MSSCVRDNSHASEKLEDGACTLSVDMAVLKDREEVLGRVLVLCQTDSVDDAVSQSFSKAVECSRSNQLIQDGFAGCSRGSHCGC
jgi:predicted transcriptional regulator